MDLISDHGLWGIVMLWGFTAYQVRGRPKPMGYHGVWVIAAMG